MANPEPIDPSVFAGRVTALSGQDVATMLACLVRLPHSDPAAPEALALQEASRLLVGPPENLPAVLAIVGRCISRIPADQRPNADTFALTAILWALMRDEITARLVNSAAAAALDQMAPAGGTQ